MLKLGRSEGESVIIDGKITVTVVRVDGGRVVLGVEAPREIPVHRAEIQRHLDKGTFRGPMPGERGRELERARRLEGMLIEDFPEVARLLGARIDGAGARRATGIRIDEEWLKEID
jgi:carbon storage regulator